MTYHDMRAKHGINSLITEKQRRDIKKAIELRRQIYRRREKMIEEGREELLYIANGAGHLL